MIGMALAFVDGLKSNSGIGNYHMQGKEGGYDQIYW
jgi:hypothetical protein